MSLTEIQKNIEDGNKVSVIDRVKAFKLNITPPPNTPSVTGKRAESHISSHQ